MDNETIVQVTNRSIGSVSYSLPELHLERHYAPRETKEIKFEELKALNYTTGGNVLICQCLAIKSEEALRALNIEVEQEYFYTEDEIKKIMVSGTMDEFLDMLDFAPEGVLTIVKNLAVSLPLNDVQKRDAIFEKLDFNVTKAIEIQNSNFDSGDEDTSAKAEIHKRRVEAPAKEETTAETPTVPTRRVVKKIN